MIEKQIAELKEFLCQASQSLAFVEEFVCGPTPSEVHPEEPGAGLIVDLARCSTMAREMAKMAARLCEKCRGDAPATTSVPGPY